MTQSAVSCGIDHICWRNPYWKAPFFEQFILSQNIEWLVVSVAIYFVTFLLLYELIQNQNISPQTWNKGVFPACIYLLKVNNRNTRSKCKLCSKWTIEQRSGVFIINFEHISHLVLAFLLLTLNMKLTDGFILQIIHHALL